MNLFQPIPPNSYTSMKKKLNYKKKRHKVIGKTRKETGHTFYYILIIPKTSRCITESHTRQSHTKRNEIINPFLKRRVRERSRHATQHSPWSKSGANNHYDINKQYTTCQYQRTFFLTGNGLSSFHYPPQRTPYPGMNRNAEP